MESFQDDGQVNPLFKWIHELLQDHDHAPTTTTIVEEPSPAMMLDNTQNIINYCQSNPLPWTLIHNFSKSRARVTARKTESRKTYPHSFTAQFPENHIKNHNLIHCCKCRATKPQILKLGLMFFACRPNLLIRLEVCVLLTKDENQTFNRVNTQKFTAGTMTPTEMSCEWNHNTSMLNRNKTYTLLSQKT